MSAMKDYALDVIEQSVDDEGLTGEPSAEALEVVRDLAPDLDGEALRRAAVALAPRCPVHGLTLVDGRCLVARIACESCENFPLLDEAFCCPRCGVLHGDRCVSCGHRGYHMDGCQEVK